LASGASCAAHQPASSPPSSSRDGTTDQNREAFFAAIARGDDATIESMLAHTPALANERNRKGRSAYLAALMRTVAGEGFIPPQENHAVAIILARHPMLDAFEVAAAGDTERVKVEIARDVSYVKRVHDNGWTPLHFASFGGQTQVVEFLLAHGADIDAIARNKFANTPLQVALLTRQRDVVRVLLARRANVRIVQGEGFCAIHDAAESGDVEIATLLLDAGADPNVRSTTGEDGHGPGVTPLEIALKHGHAKVAALLRARGARE
jgi:hypothetical protein